VRVSEGSKGSLGGTPGQLLRDVLMKVRVDSGIRLFVIGLQSQEVVTALGAYLARASHLAAHSIDRHNTAFESYQLEEVWKGGDLIGLAISFDWANNEPPMIRTPRREHGQWGRRSSPIKRRFHGLAIQGDEGAVGELRDRLGPGQKARLQAARIEAGKDAAKGIVGGNPVRQGAEGLKPGSLALAKEFHVLEPFPAGQQRAYGKHQDIEEVVRLGALNAWVL
jgi:hypothetical protein